MNLNAKKDEIRNIQHILGMAPDPAISVTLKELNVWEPALNMECAFLNFLDSYSCKQKTDELRNEADDALEFARKKLNLKMSGLKKAMIKAINGDKTLMRLAGLADYTRPRSKALDTLVGHWYRVLEHGGMIADNCFAAIAFCAEGHHKLTRAREVMVEFTEARATKTQASMDEKDMNRNCREALDILMGSYNHFMIGLRTNWLINPSSAWNMLQNMLFDPSHREPCPMEEVPHAA